MSEILVENGVAKVFDDEAPGSGASSIVSSLQDMAMKLDKLYLIEYKAKKHKIGMWKNHEDMKDAHASKKNAIFFSDFIMRIKKFLSLTK